MKNINVQLALNDWENPLAELLAVCCLWYEHDLPDNFDENIEKKSILNWLGGDVELVTSKAKKLNNLYLKVALSFDGDVEDQEDNIYELVDYISSTALKKIISSPKVEDTVVKVVKDSVLYLLKDSEPAYNRVLKHIKSAPFWLNALDVMTDSMEVIPDASDLTTIKSIVKSRKGTGTTLTVEQKKRLMIDDPELNKTYNNIRLRLTNSAKNMVRKIVISSSGDDNLVSVLEVVKKLKKSGNINILPVGFDGLVNSQCELFTTEKKKLAGNPSTAPITLNNSYDPKLDDTYVLEYKPPGGLSVQKIYTEDYKKKANDSKHDKVLEQLKRLDSAKSNWRKDMLVGIPEAFMVELLYITSARIGSIGSSTGGKPTFGLTTLQRKHLKFNNNSITMVYLGAKTKGKSKQRHLIKKKEDRHRKYVLARLAELHTLAPKPTSDIFVFEKGKVITPKEINKYIKRRVGDITAHKFRHIRGSILAIELLKEIKRRPKDQKDAEQKFKKVMEKVGKKLGHFSGDKITPMTAITYYVLPEVSKEFFNRHEFRVPKFVP